MIHTIIFDIGNVLMDWHFKTYVKDLLRDEFLVEKVRGAIYGTGYWDQLDYGVDSGEVFSRMLEAEPDYEKEIRLTLDHVAECMDKKEYAIPWIRQLKERGFRVLYLSNYSEFVMKAKPEVLDFLPLMDGGVFSCYVGMIKPDPGIYRILCREYDLVPEECVFIDDKAENIQAAKDLGMEGILFTDYHQASKDLEKLITEKVRILSGRHTLG